MPDGSTMNSCGPSLSYLRNRRKPFDATLGQTRAHSIQALVAAVHECGQSIDREMPAERSKPKRAGTPIHANESSQAKPHDVGTFLRVSLNVCGNFQHTGLTAVCRAGTGRTARQGVRGRRVHAEGHSSVLKGSRAGRPIRPKTAYTAPLAIQLAFTKSTIG